MNHRRQRPRLRRLAGGAAWIVLAGCGDGTPDRSATQAPPSARADAAPQTAPEMPTQTAADIAPDARSPSASPTAFALVDATDELGIDVRYRSRPAGDHHLAAIMGGGVAAFDANGDGRIDLYFTNGHDGTDASPYRDRLLVQRADGTFEDATDAAGLGHRGFGMGVAVGDVDNDGDLDLFVANVGPDVLYRNEGDGRFTDATDAAGVGGGEAWSASATFLDYDGDGFLDLYVCRYLAFDPARACFDNLGRPEFCGPSTFPALPDRLYRNRGDGTFEDASAASGIASEAFAGLGVVAADLDDDGRMDLFVANDRHPNLLWRNLGDGTFAEEAMLSGSAFNADGRAEAGMGVAAGDPDEDGDLDLFLTHLTSSRTRSTAATAPPASWMRPRPPDSRCRAWPGRDGGPASPISTTTATSTSRSRTERCCAAPTTCGPIWRSGARTRSRTTSTRTTGPGGSSRCRTRPPATSPATWR